MVIRAIGGLSVEEFTESEKEIAAKAIECGYLYKEGDKVFPKMIVVDGINEKAFNELPYLLNKNMQGIVDVVAEELGAFMKKHIPYE